MPQRPTPSFVTQVDSYGASLSARATGYVQATNAAAAVTLPAAAGVANVIDEVIWSYSGNPTGGALTITDDGATVFSVDITSAGPGFVPFPNGLRGGLLTSLVVTLAAAGSGVVGKLNVMGARTDPLNSGETGLSPSPPPSGSPSMDFSVPGNSMYVGAIL